MKTSVVRSRKGLLIGVMFAALAVPAIANAQATRTWVSGVGDDANPCSRTAPCKTFAGAISKTAPGGEINCLDPGGFGAVTITKSIEILCSTGTAGVLVSGTNGIVVQAAATDTVILEGLDFDGVGTGLNGVRITQAKSVKILNSEIYGFTQNAIDFEPTNAGAKLFVSDDRIFNNTGDGVLVAPAAGGNATATVTNSRVSGNGCGLAATSHLSSGSYTVSCDTSTGAGGSAKLNAFNNVITDSDATGGATGSTGIYANGQSTTVRIGNNVVITNNNGIKADDPGLGGIFSFGDNDVVGNISNGAPNGTITKV